MKAKAAFSLLVILRCIAGRISRVFVIFAAESVHLCPFLAALFHCRQKTPVADELPDQLTVVALRDDVVRHHGGEPHLASRNPPRPRRLCVEVAVAEPRTACTQTQPRTRAGRRAQPTRPSSS